MIPALIAVAVAVVLASGCDAPTEPSFDRPALPPLTSAVTGAAQAAIGPDGLFRVPTDTLFGGDSLISPVRARALLHSALQRRYLPYEVWSRGGAYVKLTYPDIRICGEPRLTRTWTLPITDSVTARTRWSFAPWFSALVCDPDAIVRGTISVTALATSAGLSDSALAARLDQDAGVDSFASPLELEPVFSAEQAAVIAFALTGRRVTSIPLPIPTFGSRGLAYRWRVELESRVRYRENTSGHVDSALALVVAYGRPHATLAIIDSVAAEPLPFDATDYPDGYTGAAKRIVLTLSDTARRRVLPVTMLP